MKRFTSLLIILFIFSTLMAQTDHHSGMDINDDNFQPQLKSSQNIGNFQITDSDGIEWDLHELLGTGITVIIDLFFST
jgi:cytochrome oxidase Cu insertion factor (SCO1/SenC/PrrC family)